MCAFTPKFDELAFGFFDDETDPQERWLWTNTLQASIMAALFVLMMHLVKAVACMVLTELSAGKLVDLVLEDPEAYPNTKASQTKIFSLLVMASIIVLSVLQVIASLLGSLHILSPAVFLMQISQGLTHLSNFSLIATAFVAYNLTRTPHKSSPRSTPAQAEKHVELSIDGAMLVEEPEEEQETQQTQETEGTEDTEGTEQPQSPSQNLLEPLQQAQASYISAAAHDLNTPLQSFYLGLELLKQTGLSAAQAEIVAQTAVAVDLMKLTIAQAVDAQRLAGGFRLLPQPAFTVLGSVVDRVSRIIRGYGITVPVSFDIAPSVSEGILVDEDWLWQMLTTLIFTACKNTAHDIHNTITTRTYLSPTNTIAEFVRGSNQDLLRNVLKQPLAISTSNTTQLMFEITTMCSDAECCNADVWGNDAASDSSCDIGMYTVRARVDALNGTYGSRNIPDTITSVDNVVSNNAVVWFAVPYVPARKAVTPKVSVCSPVSVCDVDVVSSVSSVGSVGSVGSVVNADASCSASVVDGVGGDGESVSRRSSVNSVTFSDPCASTCNSPAHHSTSTEEEEELRARIKHAQLTAILVEDTVTIRKLMERTLLQMGFARVECYENGQLGLEALLGGEVDIVFSDVQMPVMCGDVMVREFRAVESTLLQTQQTTPTHTRAHKQTIVAVTANGAEFTDLVGCGFDSVAPKPVSKKTLFAIVETYLNKKEGVVV